MLAKTMHYVETFFGDNILIQKAIFLLNKVCQYFAQDFFNKSRRWVPKNFYLNSFRIGVTTLSTDKEHVHFGRIRRYIDLIFSGLQPGMDYAQLFFVPTYKVFSIENP